MSGATEVPPAASPRCFVASFMERTATSRLAFEAGSRRRSPRAFACSTAVACESRRSVLSAASLSLGRAEVSRRMTFQVPLMISFWSSASLSASWAFPPPSWDSSEAEPGGGSPCRKISSKWRTSAKYMSPSVRRGLPSGPTSSAQTK